MRKIFYTFILLVILTLNTSIVQSAESVITDVIYNGIQKEYDINGVHYKVEVVLLSSYESRAVYRINGEIKRLKLHEVISLNENTDFRLDEIIELSYQERTVISFIFKTDCGNDVCDQGETCSSCVQDCTCKSGYKCDLNKCIEDLVCGDNKCSSQETCITDNCCNGVTYPLNSDKNNCGSCRNICYVNQDCVSGSCINLTEYCGDGICSSNEKCGICDLDCICSNNTKCEINKCVTYCGNGICESDEEGICKADCIWCGDGKCNNDETYQICPNDCKKPVICGDSVCDSNENCCLDCGCSIGFQCINKSCVTIYECVSNSDCKTNETCVNNRCVLAQKISQENLTYVSNLTVIRTNKTTTQNETDQSLIKEEKSVLQVIIEWFLNLLR